MAGLAVLAWGLVLGGILAVGWLLTDPLEPTVDPWDDDVARWFADQRTGTLTEIADVGTLLGETVVGSSFIALVGLAFALWQRSWRPAFFVVVLTAGLGGFYWCTTTLITRDRPPVEILDPGLVANDSFPSGHVATATAAYAGLMVLLWVFAPAVRRWAWLLVLLPLFDVWARLYEGAHHVSDVAVSVLYASVWLAVLARVVLVPARVEPRTEVSSER